MLMVTPCVQNITHGGVAARHRTGASPRACRYRFFTAWERLSHCRQAAIIEGMRYWIVHWLLSGIALFIVAKILPGIEVDSLGAAFIAALVIGLVSATVGLILKILLLPFIIVTLGVVYFLINGLMLKLASEFVPGFRVNGCLPAIIGSILLTVVDYVLSRMAGLR
jgi:putative membrane protein